MSSYREQLVNAGYDSEQIDMMDEDIIIVDENDIVHGSISKAEAHQGGGTLHRAFSILLFDDDDRLLIQKRAEHKITFPDVWANTVCSHPLYVSDELDGDDLGSGAKVAAVRKMEQELGIHTNTIDTEDIHFITRMMYKSRADDLWVEHELDHILFARAPLNMKLNPNPNEISELLWITQDELDKWLVGEMHNEMIIAPWFRCIAEQILPKCWDNLNDFSSLSDDMIHDMGDVSHMISAIHRDSSPSFIESLSMHKDAVETRIIHALNKTSNPRLSSAMRHLIDGGGKRLRAILPWLVADAVGSTSDGLYDLGSSIEIIHNFTLVHDDIMDNDSMRRGRPAVHVAFDYPTAINAGDAMLAVAFEILAESEHYSPDHFRNLVRIIGNMVRRVSEGQQKDMSFEERDDVTESEYLEMISGKTAAMFTTCARTGAILSGASNEIIEIMAEWGENVGLCFQLMDDLIDATGDSITLGKPACSDIIEGKQTLIAIHALQQDSDILPTFHEVFGSGIDDTDRIVLDSVVSELVKSGSIEYAKLKAMSYHEAAHECLRMLPNQSELQILKEITDYQLVRMN